jgi:hypothetical protein
MTDHKEAILDSQYRADIDIVARHHMNLAVMKIPWDLLPGSEEDFREIATQVERLLPDDATTVEFDDAYERLEARAKEIDDE